jgi:hypothetical protein
MLYGPDGPSLSFQKHSTVLFSGFIHSFFLHWKSLDFRFHPLNEEAAERATKLRS